MASLVNCYVILEDDVECKNGKKVPERPDELKTFLTGHIIKLFDDGIRLVNEVNSYFTANSF